MKVVSFILVDIGEYRICHNSSFLTNINIRFVRIANTSSLWRVDWLLFEYYSNALDSAVFEVLRASAVKSNLGLHLSIHILLL